MIDLNSEKNNEKKSIQSMDDIEKTAQELKNINLNAETRERFESLVETSLSYLASYHETAIQNFDKKEKRLKKYNEDKRIQHILEGVTAGGVPIDMYKLVEAIVDILKNLVNETMYGFHILKIANEKYKVNYNVNQSLDIQSKVFKQFRDFSKSQYDILTETNNSYNSHIVKLINGREDIFAKAMKEMMLSVQNQTNYLKAAIISLENLNTNKDTKLKELVDNIKDVDFSVIDKIKENQNIMQNTVNKIEKNTEMLNNDNPEKKEDIKKPTLKKDIVFPEPDIKMD